MNANQMARESAHSMRSATGRNWVDYWMALLRQSENVPWRRLICLQALISLGHPQRTPGEDDE